jgi:hypothetical protein
MQRHHTQQPLPLGRDRAQVLPEGGTKEPLQVRIPQDVKRRFKAHAAMLGIPSHELFVEVWKHYERTRP